MSLKRNVVANFAGNIYVVALQFSLVPILLRYLGQEGYGLIGIYATFLALINLLDFGLSPTLTRELARLSAIKNSSHLLNATMRTLETLCVGVAMIIIITFVLGAPLLSKYWLSDNNMQATTVTYCLQLMGVQASFQLITNLYTNGMLGMQHMVKANVLLILNHTTRALLGLFVLIQLGRDVEIYFLSQLVATFIGLLFTKYAMTSSLPKIKESFVSTKSLLKSRFDLNCFNTFKKYTVSLAIISFCSFLIMQTDKIILTKIVSLKDFGLYSIAASVSITVAGGAGLVSRAVLPKMTQLVVLNNIDELKEVYFKSLSAVAWLILIVASILIYFNTQFLNIYLGNDVQLNVISPVFMLLMLGYALHSLMYIPYALTLAYNWVGFGIVTSITAFIIMTPLTILLTLQNGILGAAYAWVIITIMYLCFCLVFLHSKILKGELYKSYKTIAFPLLVLVSTFIYRYFF